MSLLDDKCPDHHLRGRLLPRCRASYRGALDKEATTLARERPVQGWAEADRIHCPRP